MTTEKECIDALREAASKLGESPTKAAYEELGLQPASGTIIRTMGGWNDAKEAAGLETYYAGQFGGDDVEPKPDDIELPEDVTWEELSDNQRWYYKNRQQEIEKKDRRRAELRSWLHEYKLQQCACVRCGEGDPACLDFHHTGEKEMGIAEMVMYGYSRESILEEIERCEVLCANCHRKEHYVEP
ncbi:homing endonuclease associated repeat-containing protein [Haloarchaeobius litoreus]|uniref:Homing endonuclease associated repeat-containing protein n=1 Tax=Haloarchaeobius litoreus TaxID=755306 RepID=A0ABD6DKQ7_9EURY|nr:HNH endonuclease [Haloarchaeobius litoreus]